MSTQIANCFYKLKDNAYGAARIPEDLVQNPTASQMGPENRLKHPGIHKLLCGGLFFVVMTVGIFWYQFTRIPGGNRPDMWNQLQWGYLFWLLLFLPIDTLAAGSRIWVICRVLQPGISFWTCLKAEWANLGLAMLTPSQTGGGFGQIYVLNRGGLNMGTALSVSLITFLGSMVVLLFIGIHSLLIAGVEHLAVFFQGAFLIFFLVFGALIVAVCWPGSLRLVACGFSMAIIKIYDKGRSPDNINPAQNSRIERLTNLLHNTSEKLIRLCYMHQVSIRRFFSLKKSSFLWVCLLSLIFLLSRSIMAFLCMRFLGIQASSLLNVIESQLRLIFLTYFAPTPGSSGLAEAASMLMMEGAMPAGFVPYYNLLWRGSTLYLPAIAGLVFLSWTVVKDARRVVGRRQRKVES
jgi:uncharacterized protein (TIRG00374 family)